MHLSRHMIEATLEEGRPTLESLLEILEFCAEQRGDGKFVTVRVQVGGISADLLHIKMQGNTVFLSDE